MLYRKIQNTIEQWLNSNTGKILVIDGARQIGKSYIIRHIGQTRFKNYIELNLLEDAQGIRQFEHVRTTDEFYFQLSVSFGGKMGTKRDTLVFLDEIQAYPHLLTLFKFLRQEDRYTYIASGSLLGVTLAQTSSIPMGSIEVKHMYPLDFEEFLMANGFGGQALTVLRQKYERRESLDGNTHDHLMDLFKKYLLVGGLPEAVNAYVETKNIQRVRAIQQEIYTYYGFDASKYDAENRLKIRRIYDMIPSALENKKKRIVIQDIEGKKGKRFSNYRDEFDYLIHAGIALEVKAVSTPVFPLIASSGKNLLKLYLNDVGLLTNVLYRNNVRAVLADEKSVNLGSVYEAVVASELRAHGFNLYYYDNKAKGEVDYLIDDYGTLSVLPIEVKSGKDYTVHSALNTFVSQPDYHVKQAYVFSNEREVKNKGVIVYLPIYYIMFLDMDRYTL